MRYGHELRGGKWQIIDRQKNETIGLLNSGYVAAQVVQELNKMEQRRG